MARLAMAATLAMLCSAAPSRAQAEEVPDGCPEIIVATFGDRAPQACRVSLCESTWRSWAVSPDGQNIGIFQINVVWGEHATTDLERNVAFAYELSRQGTDWSAWACG